MCVGRAPGCAVYRFHAKGEAGGEGAGGEGQSINQGILFDIDCIYMYMNGTLEYISDRLANLWIYGASIVVHSGAVVVILLVDNTSRD